jgi:hypothetical protein
MKKLFFTIVVALFFSPSLYAQIEIDNEANKKAETAWQNIDDYTDTQLLDSFIAKFPDTTWARVAFAFRYSLIAQNPSIEDYNTFLAKYPDRFQSQFAIHEVFKLYREQDRVKHYLEFINKYPHATEHTLVAKMRLHALLANLVCLIDKLEDYESFIAAFPDAAQIPSISELAYKKVFENEKKFFDESPETEREKRANALVTDWGKLITDFNKKYNNTKLTENGIGTLDAFRIQWQEKVIINVYKEYRAAGEVRNENRHSELMNKLDVIHKTLQDNHAELVKTIREESEKPRKVLREEFAKLGSKIDAGFNKLADKLDILHNDLVAVNNALLTIHVDLQDINKSIQETNKALAQLDKRLEDVNNSLVEIYNITNENFSVLRSDLDRNFKQMGEKIDAVGVKVEKGFERNFQMQVKQLEATVQISGQLADLSEITKNGFGRVLENQIIQQNLSKATLNEVQNVNRGIAGLQQGQEQQIAIAHATLNVTNDIARTQIRALNEIQGMRSDMNYGFSTVSQDLRGIRNDMNRGFHNVSNTMKAGFEKIDKSIWQSSDRLMQSNMQMQQNIQQQIAASKQRNSSSSSSSSGGSSVSKSRSIWGKVLGGAAGAVATYFGGPVAGAAVGTLVNKVVTSGGKAKGKDIIASTAVDYISKKNPVVGGVLRDVTQDVDGKTVLTNAARTAIEQKYPETSKIVESLLAMSAIERKNLLISAAANLADGGLLPEEIDRISNCKNADDLIKAITAIANRIGVKPEIIMYAADFI